MPFFKTITQGGQVHLHQLRMFKQVFVSALLGSLALGGLYFGWLCTHLPPYAWRALYEVTVSDLLLTVTPTEMHKKLSITYTPPSLSPLLKKQTYARPSYRRRCVSISQDPFLKRRVLTLKKDLQEVAYKSLVMSGVIFSCLLFLWFMMGFFRRKTKHQRGNTFVSWTGLRTILKRKRQASDLRLSRSWWKGGGKLPLVKNKETSHILITGTTGSGKTNTFHQLLPQIRKRGDRAIIIDITGDYVSRYFDPKQDILLNPLDARSYPWHPWADCHLDSHYDVFAEALIQPKETTKDPFWDMASRIILKTALRKYAERNVFDISQLTSFLLTSSEREFEAFFKGTEAATFSSKNNDKTTHSIRSVLSSQITCLKHLKVEDTPPFSIRNWVMNDDHPGWLFITARADQRQTLTPLISAWVDIAINALMVLPEDPKRRLWFVVDELAALQKLPRLSMGLAEARKYGGCFLVGFQSKPQLEEIYGRNGAAAMLDLFNTKIFFRCTEPSTQHWISRVLGDKEALEPQENISYGAHSMRDGVSLSQYMRHMPLVMPTELSLLKDLECYLKFPGEYPCTKFRAKYVKRRSKIRTNF